MSEPELISAKPELPRPVSARDCTPGGNLGIDRALITRVVHRFYDEIRTDDMLAPIFDARIAPERWPVHLEIMVEFWSSVLLTTATYKGRPVPAHLPLPIDDRHFRRWLGLFESVVRQLCPPPAADLFLDRAQRIAASLRYAIATQKAVDSPGSAPVFPSPLG